MRRISHLRDCRVLAVGGGTLLAVSAICFFYFKIPESEESLLRRGYELLWRGDSRNRASAIRLFETALRRNPSSPYRWCDLGEAKVHALRWNEARFCYTRAAELGPNIPPVLMRAANFHFRRGENKEALQYGARILRLTDAYDSLLFGTYLRLVDSQEDVLRHGLPQDSRVASAYLSYVIRKGSSADAEMAWEWTHRHSLADDRLASRYVNFLVQNHQYDAARSAWVLHLEARAGDYPSTNLVFNGGFEQDFTESKLDWLARPVSAVEVSRDAGLSHSGRFSLRLRFDGKTNVNYGHTAQVAAVQPGWHRFQAFVRTEQLSTDRGIGFRIFDPELPGRLDMRTEEVRGTNPWTAVERVFLVPRETRALTVQVTRQPSLKFDNQIAGTVWIDDVSLVPVKAE